MNTFFNLVMEIDSEDSQSSREKDSSQEVTEHINPW